METETSASQCEILIADQTKFLKNLTNIFLIKNFFPQKKKFMQYWIFPLVGFVTYTWNSQTNFPHLHHIQNQLFECGNQKERLEWKTRALRAPKINSANKGVGPFIFGPKEGVAVGLGNISGPYPIIINEKFSFFKKLENNFNYSFLENSLEDSRIENLNKTYFYFLQKKIFYNIDSSHFYNYSNNLYWFHLNFNPTAIFHLTFFKNKFQNFLRPLIDKRTETNPLRLLTPWALGVTQPPTYTAVFPYPFGCATRIRGEQSLIPFRGANPSGVRAVERTRGEESRPKNFTKKILPVFLNETVHPYRFKLNNVDPIYFYHKAKGLLENQFKSENNFVDTILDLSKTNFSFLKKQQNFFYKNKNKSKIFENFSKLLHIHTNQMHSIKKATNLLTPLRGVTLTCASSLTYPPYIYGGLEGLGTKQRRVKAVQKQDFYSTANFSKLLVSNKSVAFGPFIFGPTPNPPTGGKGGKGGQTKNLAKTSDSNLNCDNLKIINKQLNLDLNFIFLSKHQQNFPLIYRTFIQEKSHKINRLNPKQSLETIKPSRPLSLISNLLLPSPKPFGRLARPFGRLARPLPPTGVRGEEQIKEKKLLTYFIEIKNFQKKIFTLKQLKSQITKIQNKLELLNSFKSMKTFGSSVQSLFVYKYLDSNPSYRSIVKQLHPSHKVSPNYLYSMDKAEVNAPLIPLRGVKGKVRGALPPNQKVRGSSANPPLGGKRNSSVGGLGEKQGKAEMQKRIVGPVINAGGFLKPNSFKNQILKVSPNVQTCLQANFNQSIRKKNSNNQLKIFTSEMYLAPSNTPLDSLDYNGNIQNQSNLIDFRKIQVKCLMRSFLENLTNNFLNLYKNKFHFVFIHSIRGNEFLNNSSKTIYKKKSFNKKLDLEKKNLEFNSVFDTTLTAPLTPYVHKELGDTKLKKEKIFRTLLSSRNILNFKHTKNFSNLEKYRGQKQKFLEKNQKKQILIQTLRKLKVRMCELKTSNQIVFQINGKNFVPILGQLIYSPTPYVHSVTPSNSSLTPLPPFGGLKDNRGVRVKTGGKKRSDQNRFVSNQKFVNKKIKKLNNAQFILKNTQNYKNLRKKHKLSLNQTIQKIGFIFLKKQSNSILSPSQRLSSGGIRGTDKAEKTKVSANLIKQKYFQKKRRRKKLKLENRRRKKRKRFYPRPIWLRYNLYRKFLNNRYNKNFLIFNTNTKKVLRYTKKSERNGSSGVSTPKGPKAVDPVFLKPFVLPLPPINLWGVRGLGKALSASAGAKGNKKSFNRNNAKTMNKLLDTKQKLKLLLQRNNKEKWGNFALDTNLIEKNSLKKYILSTNLPIYINKNYYKISNLLQEFMPLYWKSYWLRTNLKPYMNRIEKNLDYEKLITLNQSLSLDGHNWKLFLSNLLGDFLFISNASTAALPVTPLLTPLWGVRVRLGGKPFTHMSGALDPKAEQIYRHRRIARSARPEGSRQVSFEKTPISFYSNKKNSFQNIDDFSFSNMHIIENMRLIKEHDRILFDRISEIIQNIKYNLTLDGENSIISYKLPKSRYNLLNNSFKSTQLSQTNSLLNSLKSSLFQQLDPNFSVFSAFNFTTLNSEKSTILKPYGASATLRVLWAFNKTNLFSFKEKNSIKNLWETYKNSEQSKSNQTKKFLKKTFMYKTETAFSNLKWASSHLYRGGNALLTLTNPPLGGKGGKERKQRGVRQSANKGVGQLIYSPKAGTTRILSFSKKSENSLMSKQLKQNFKKNQNKTNIYKTIFLNNISWKKFQNVQKKVFYSIDTIPNKKLFYFPSAPLMRSFSNPLTPQRGVRGLEGEKAGVQGNIFYSVKNMMHWKHDYKSKAYQEMTNLEIPLLENTDYVQKPLFKKSSSFFWWSIKNFFPYFYFLENFSDSHILKTFYEIQYIRSLSNQKFNKDCRPNQTSLSSFIVIFAILFHLCIFLNLFKLPELRNLLKFQLSLIYKVLNIYFITLNSFYTSVQKFQTKIKQSFLHLGFITQNLSQFRYKSKTPLFHFNNTNLNLRTHVAKKSKKADGMQLHFPSSNLLMRYFPNPPYGGVREKPEGLRTKLRGSHPIYGAPPMYIGGVSTQRITNKFDSLDYWNKCKPTFLIFQNQKISFFNSFKFFLKQKQSYWRSMHFFKPIGSTKTSIQSYFKKYSKNINGPLESLSNSKAKRSPPLPYARSAGGLGGVRVALTSQRGVSARPLMRYFPYLLVSEKPEGLRQKVQGEKWGMERYENYLSFFLTVISRFIVGFSIHSMQLSYKLLLKIIEIIESFLLLIYKFLEKPAELMIESIAQIFLIEWISDICTYIPETLDKNLWEAFQKLSSSTNFLAVLYSGQFLAIQKGSLVLPSFSLTLNPYRDWAINQLPKTGNLAQVQVGPYLSPLPNPSQILGGTHFLAAIPISLIFVNITKQFYYNLWEFLFKPDMDLITRQKKGIYFMNIWAEIFIQAAEKYQLNVASLVTNNSEQEKFMERLLKDPEIFSFNKIDSQKRTFRNKELMFQNQKNAANFFKVSQSPSPSHSKPLTPRRGVRGNGLRDPLPFGQGKERSVTALPGGLGDNNLKSLISNNSSSINQHIVSSCFGGQYTEQSDLFLDIAPPKSFHSISYLHSPIYFIIGPILCEVYSGLFSKKVSKNILLVTKKTNFILKNLNSSNIHISNFGSFLIEALAGETEMKLIIDNAKRYSLNFSNKAIGIRLLKDVFMSIALQTPSFYMLEDIHFIAEKRPMLIGNSENTSSNAINLEQDEIHFQNQYIYELSRHKILDYKRPYKGDSALIPANIYSKKLFQTKSNFSNSKTFKKQKKHPLSGHTFSSKNNVGAAQGPLPPKGGPKGGPKRGPKGGPKGGLGLGDENFQKMHEKTLLRSRLQITSEEFFAAPSTSPFTILLLKDQKKIKFKKASKYGISWLKAIPNLPNPPLGGKGGNGGTKNSKNIDLSIRSKIAELAHITLRNFAGSVDMITDLLVIVDSVRSNRGFVVFATTPVPSILDPALRRPGRFDETLCLPEFDLKYESQIIQKSYFQILNNLEYSPELPKLRQTEGNKHLLYLDSFTYNIQKNPKLTNLFPPQPLCGLGLTPQCTLGIGQSIDSLTPNPPIGGLTPLTPQRGVRGGNATADTAVRGFTNLNNIMGGSNDQLCALGPPFIYGGLTPLTPQRGVRGVRSAPAKKNLLKILLICSKFVSNYLTQVDFLKNQTNQNLDIKMGSYHEGVRRVKNWNHNFITIFSSSFQYKNFMLCFLAETLIADFFYCSPITPLSMGWVGQQPLPLALPPVGGRASLPNGRASLPNGRASLPNGLGEGRTDFSTNKTVSFSTKVTREFIYLLLQKRYLLHKNFIVSKMLSLENLSNSLKEPPGPPVSEILMPSKKYEAFKTTEQEFTLKNSFSIYEKMHTHQKQRFLKKLYNQPIQIYFKSLSIASNFDDFTTFINSFKELGSVAAAKNSKTLLLKGSSTNYYYKTRFLVKHRFSLTNQWWNAQLPEHNIETTFLSDVDWRSMYLQSNKGSSGKKQSRGLAEQKDQFIDFPDADQYYNPRIRKWILNHNFSNKLNFENIFTYEIYYNFLMQSFFKIYNYFDKNRELLDYCIYSYLYKGSINLNSIEFNSIFILSRFYKK